MWAASIHEFSRQLERPRTDDRTDRLLWTLIQDGLVEEDKDVLSLAHQQVKRFAAVGMSRLMAVSARDRGISERLEREMGELRKALSASDLNTTVCRGHPWRSSRG